MVSVEICAQDSQGFSILERFDTEKIRDELSEWDQSVRGFRKMHHLSLLCGPTDGTWRIARFAGQYGETFRDEGIMTKIFYSYHIQIFQGFGYFLGTGIGYWQKTGSKGKDSGFDIQSTEQVPGVLLGLTQNISPGFRANAGLYYGMERLRHFRFKDSEGTKTMTGTARSFDWLFSFEVFFKLNYALGITYYLRDLTFTTPKNAEGYTVDAQIRKTEDWLAFGLIYHLL